MKGIFICLITSTFTIVSMIKSMERVTALMQSYNSFYQEYGYFPAYPTVRAMQQGLHTLPRKRKIISSLPSSDFSEGEQGENIYSAYFSNKYQKEISEEPESNEKKYEESEVIAYKAPYQSKEVDYTTRELTVLSSKVTKDIKALALAYSSNGKKLAIGGALSCRGKEGSKLKLVDIKTKNYDELCGHTGAVVALACDTEGIYLLSGSEDKKMILWDVNEPELVRLWTMPGTVNSLAFKPDNNNVILFTLNHREGVPVLYKNYDDGFSELGFTDLRQPRVDWLGGHVGGMHKAVYNPIRPHEIISLGHDKVVLQWDVRNLKTHAIHEKTNATTFALNDKGDQLAVQIARGKIKIYGLEGDRCRDIAVITIKDESGEVSDCSFEAMTYTHGGKELIIAHGGTLTVCDTHLPYHISSPCDIGSHTISLSSLVSNPVEPSQIASADPSIEPSDNPLRLWELARTVKVIAHTKQLRPVFEDTSETDNLLDTDELFNINALGALPSVPN